MRWHEDFETGIPAVDEQHKDMFRQLDRLVDHGNKNRVEEALDFLGDYVLKHFGTEEIMQKSSKYPKAAEHRRLHEDFVKRYLALKRQHQESGESSLILMKLIGVVGEWLDQHIKGEDKDFAEFFKKKTVQPPGGGRRTPLTRIY